MRKIIFSCLFLLLFLPSVCGQQVSGTLTDEKGLLVPFATVTLLQLPDSAIVAYQTTDEGGVYRLTPATPGKYVVRVRALGYEMQQREADLTAGAMRIDFVLGAGAVHLKEVTVKGTQRGIQFGEDTIRYNPKLFTDGSEVVLGDILNKLPGIEVDEKGSVKAEGKAVDKIMLNGQDFFAGNTQMATKNLPADIADTVEILRNYSEYSLFGGFQSQEQTVINIGVNKERWGKISGSLAAAGGVEDRYHLRGTVLQMQPKYMLSLMGAANNNGEEVLSMEDYIRLQGGFGELAGGSGGRFELSEAEQQLLMLQNNTYTRTNGLGAMNVSCQPSSQWRSNAYFLYNRNRTNAADANRYTYDLPGQAPFTSYEQQQDTSRSDLLSGYVKLAYQPDPSRTLTYKGYGSYIGMHRPISTYRAQGEDALQVFARRNAETVSTKQQLQGMKLLGRNLLIANVSFSYDDKPASYRMQTDSLLLPLSLVAVDGWYYVRQQSERSRYAYNADLAYLYRLHPMHYLRFVMAAAREKQEYGSALYQTLAGEVPLLLPADSLQNETALSMNDFNLQALWVKNKGLLRFKIGGSTHTRHFVTNQDGVKASSNRFRLQPQAEGSLHFSDRHQLKLGYSESVALQDPEAFADGLYMRDYASYHYGSRMKEVYRLKQDYRLLYSIFDLYSGTTFNLSGGYNWTKQAETGSYRQEGVVSLSVSVPSSPTGQWYGFFFLDQTLGFIPWKAHLEGQANYTTLYSFQEERENKIRMTSAKGNLLLESRYKGFLNAKVGAGLEYIRNRLSFGASSEQIIRRYTFKLKMTNVKKWTAEAGLEYVNNDSPTRRQELYTLNVSIRYSLSKAIRLELAGENMLNLDRQEWTSVSYHANYTLERYYRQLPGNMMLRAYYRF